MLIVRVYWKLLDSSCTKVTLLAFSGLVPLRDRHELQTGLLLTFDYPGTIKVQDEFVETLRKKSKPTPIVAASNSFGRCPQEQLALGSLGSHKLRKDTRETVHWIMLTKGPALPSEEQRFLAPAFSPLLYAAISKASFLLGAI